MTATQINCPKCNTLIAIDEVLSHQAEEKYKKVYEQQLQEELNAQAAAKQKLEQDKADFEEKKKNENELFQAKLNQKLEEISKKIQQEELQKATKKYEFELKKQEDQQKEQQQEIQQLKQQKLEFLKKEAVLEEQQKNYELTLLEAQKKIKLELEQKIKQEKDSEVEILKKEFKLKEEQQAKLIEELKRKSEQGSMQLQGEKMEVLIEEFLKEHFPLDEIIEVHKGKKGADCLQIINTRTQTQCGTIIYESKDTKAWSNDWIDKLKQDKIQANADVAVLVTSTFPRNMDRMALVNEVWVCSFDEFKGLCVVLRDSLLKLFQATASQQNKGDKMVMLYDYFTGNEFKAKWTAIREGFIAERNLITKEREMMERHWSAREKNLDKIIKNAAMLQGDIEGIADITTINLSITDTPNLIED